MWPARVAAAAFVLVAAVVPAAHAKPPLRLEAALEHGARLGGPSALRIRLSVDVRRLASPVTRMRILAPRGLDLASSGLGLATCDVAATDFESVIFRGAIPRCPQNAVLGTGVVEAAIWLDSEDRIGASGLVTLLSGPARGAHPGIVALVVANHPVRAQLAYAGTLFSAHGRFGLGIDVALPEIPDPPLGATVGLADIALTIGGRDLRYVRRAGRRRISYRPDPPTLPAHCPRSGLPFRVELWFADGDSRSTAARARCPRAVHRSGG